MVEHLKEQREHREKEVVLLHERANRQLYRCILYEQTLRVITEDDITIRRLRKRLERGRIRLNKIRKRIAQSHIDPSNSQIAKLLGISKGTVDSVLYNLRLQHNEKDILSTDVTNQPD